MKDIKNVLKDGKIVCVMRGIPVESVLDTVKAIVDGGITILEFTYDHTYEGGIEDTLKKIEIASKALEGKAYVGAGTVLTVKEVEMAASAGAKFIVSPNTNVDVIKKTKELSLLSLPGAFTPTEIQLAYESGADFVKVFPAEVGKPYLKALIGPLKHVPMIVVGGIDENNIKEYLEIGFFGAGIGALLVNEKLVNEKAFDKITEKAKRIVDAAK